MRNWKYKIGHIVNLVPGDYSGTVIRDDDGPFIEVSVTNAKCRVFSVRHSTLDVELLRDESLYTVTNFVRPNLQDYEEIILEFILPASISPHIQGTIEPIISYNNSLRVLRKQV